VIGVVKSLLKENGDPGMILSFITDGLSVLHVAAIQGHLEICKYLVEDLGGDANAPGAVAGAGVGGFFLTLIRASIFGTCHVHVRMSKMGALLRLYPRCNTFYDLCSFWRCSYCEIFP
jgi:hypothetical protein